MSSSRIQMMGFEDVYMVYWKPLKILPLKRLRHTLKLLMWKCFIDVQKVSSKSKDSRRPNVFMSYWIHKIWICVQCVFKIFGMNTKRLYYALKLLTFWRRLQSIFKVFGAISHIQSSNEALRITSSNMPPCGERPEEKSPFHRALAGLWPFWSDIVVYHVTRCPCGIDQVTSQALCYMPLPLL